MVNVNCGWEGQPKQVKLLIGALSVDPKGQLLTQGQKWQEGEEEDRRRGDTKEPGMQRVNLLRIPLPCEQRRKVGRGGHTKGDKGVSRGRGAGGRPFPNHLDLLFQEQGWRMLNWAEGTGQKTWREGSAPQRARQVNPKPESQSRCSAEPSTSNESFFTLIRASTIN